MEDVYKAEFMLFSKESCHSYKKRRLYFVDLPTLYTDTPRVHRLAARSYKVFEDIKVGSVYRVWYKRVKLKAYEFAHSYPLSEYEYEALLDLRDYIFYDEEILDELNLSDEMPFTDKYISLAEYRDIASIEIKPFDHAAILAINYALNALSTLLPAGLFVLFVYSYTLTLSSGIGGSMLSLPLVMVLSLPFVIFLMNLLYTVGNSLLYKFSYTKWALIRRHMIKYGGHRKNFFISRQTRRRLISFGIISGLTFVLSIILSNILF